jgi:protein-disulfide isomerase
MTTMNVQHAQLRSDDGNRAAPLLAALSIVAIIAIQTVTTVIGAFAATVPRPDGTVDMAKVLQTGPLPDLSMGDASGVPIVEYGSLTCPHCADFNNETFPQLKKAYIDTGKVRFIFREYPRNTPDLVGFVLARCLGDQKAFGADELLFAEQDKWSSAKEPAKALLSVMRVTGLTEEKAEECLKNRKLVEAIVAIAKTADQETHLTGVPTFVVAGKVYGGALSFDNLKAILDSLSPAQGQTGVNDAATAPDVPQGKSKGCATPQPSVRVASAQPCR